ncbi:FprA family A-type flavoprotein [Parafannyhessea umbonata]|jgi:flavorubredoxin|uniref:FprA family A-type flavoprotein n=2 Tax=Parafannyhessea umbonata TaxID=604330 RepID=UPI0026EC7626|nr:FprA family A-type flavoprotein [Parafannyhessea umbonata]MDD7198456.1 FprA family A-type flavoprotein [Parafannyhessea umbonata]MDY4419301.1 FprA family A-type flavoprotein [Parafannyhessea umbonata]
MLSAVQIKPDVYWVGAVDWNARSFHGYSTEDGITYNAYLIMDEKVTLIDTAKITFKDELLARISSVIDPSKIDVLVCNHVEMDHSGNVPTIKELNPNVRILASAPQGVKGLTAHYHDLGFEGVKTGDTLNIGKRTLTFVQTPMVHWPDNMVTYDAYDKILFSNDAFGQHFASSTRFDDENDLGEVMKQARKYYANIVQPYRMQATNAVKAVRKLGPDAIDIIAPAHGVCWRSHVADILDAYENVYTSGKLEEKALVAYDSMWGSTDKMAHAIADGFLAAGVPVRLMDVKCTHISDVMEEFLDCKYVAMGSPTLNSQMMPPMAELITYMKGLSPKNEGRVGIPFGSYGWAPLGPKNIASELEGVGFELPLGTLACNWIPDQAYLDDLRQKVVDLAK